MAGAALSQKEFRLANEYVYNRSSPTRWIWSHVWRYPWLPFVMVGSAVFNNFAAGYVQVFIGRAFDVITLPNWEITALLAIALAVFVAVAVQSLLGMSRNAAGEFLANRLERDARDELYVSLLGKSQTFHGRQRIGDIMARATNDVRALNIMFSPGIMLIIDGLMGLVAPIVLIGTVNWQLLLVPAIFLLFFTLTVRDYARQLNPVSLSMREQFGIMNAGLAEAIGGVEVVKGNAQEPQALADFGRNAARFRDDFVRQGIIQARYLPLLVYGVVLGMGLFHALWLWRANAITLGDAVALMGLLGILRFPTFISLFAFNLVQLGVASAGRILELITDETNLDENEAGHKQAVTGRVQFETVSFAYDGTPVLQDVSFTAEPGQTVAIVGQTGSGKTTLTRLINRIFDVGDGRVLVDGVDVRNWSLEALRSQISTIEQDVFLFSRTVAENIAFGCPDASRAAIEEAARQAQAHDFIMSFKEGYDTQVGERGVTLSGGQRQRIAIARAFLTDPRILILDDSTSAVDSATEDQIQRAMRQISRQRTTFLITHRLSQIRWADQIVVLANGQLVDQGTHESLLARSPAYQRIFARTE
jgi:ATP-binding cassette subfamily B protein